MGNLNTGKKVNLKENPNQNVKVNGLEESICFRESHKLQSMNSYKPQKDKYSLEEIDELATSISAFQEKIPSFDQKYLNNCVI